MANRYWKTPKSSLTESTPNIHVTPNNGASTQILLAPDLLNSCRANYLLCIIKSLWVLINRHTHTHTHTLYKTRKVMNSLKREFHPLQTDSRHAHLDMIPIMSMIFYQIPFRSLGKPVWTRFITLKLDLPQMMPNLPIQF